MEKQLWRLVSVYHNWSVGSLPRLYLLFSRIGNGNSEWKQDRLLPRFSTEYESMPKGCCDPTLIGAQCAASGTGVRIPPSL